MFFSSIIALFSCSKRFHHTVVMFSRSGAALQLAGQTLQPDAVPVCSWMKIKVLATAQAWQFTGATEQPFHCRNGHPDAGLPAGEGPSVQCVLLFSYYYDPFYLFLDVLLMKKQMSVQTDKNCHSRLYCQIRYIYLHQLKK